MKIEIVELDAEGYRKFGFLTSAIFALLFGVALPWAFDYPYPIWPWALAGILSVMALTMPLALGPIYMVWMKFGQVMNWINTRLILGILFYGIFVPVGLMLKLFGNVPIKKGFDNQLGSYRRQCEQKPKESMEKPY